MVSLNSTAQNKVSFEHYARYESENKNLLNRPADPNRIILMGNSITESWVTIDSAFFKGKSYINRGISGETTSQMLIRFRSDVIELHPKAVVLLAGINDIAENNGPISIEHIFGNIQSMIELAQVNQIEVILCSVLPAAQFPWRKHLKPAEKIIQLNELLEKYAAQHDVIYLDYYSVMVNDSKGLKQEFTYDGVHPNLKGYQVMEPLLEETLQGLLNQN
jgi:lysophospholipase L1-like esterase